MQQRTAIIRTRLPVRAGGQQGLDHRWTGGVRRSLMQWCATVISSRQGRDMIIVACLWVGSCNKTGCHRGGRRVLKEGVRVPVFATHRWR